jgi:uncharacterized membrane protein
LPRNDIGTSRMPKPLTRPYYLLILCLLLFWCGSFGLYPWLVKLPSPEIPGFLFYLFSHICHQIPGRSLRWNEISLPVCLRCFSTYTGALAAVLIFPWVHHRLQQRHLQCMMLAALTLIGADVGFHHLGWQDSWGAARVCTGGLLGVSLIWLILERLESHASMKEQSGITMPGQE